MVSVLVVAWCVWRLLAASERKWARQLIDDHERAFPGRCPVCSYHRYGLREGHERPGSRPAAHDCPEAASITRGAVPRMEDR